MNRREFLKALGIGGLAVVAPEVIEPERKLWFVPSSAPVGSRVERLGYDDAWDVGSGRARDWALKINVSEEAFADNKMPEHLNVIAEYRRAYQRQVRDIDAIYRKWCAEAQPARPLTPEPTYPGLVPRDGETWSNMSGPPVPPSRAEWLDHGHPFHKIASRVEAAERERRLATESFERAAWAFMDKMGVRQSMRPAGFTVEDETYRDEAQLRELLGWRG